MRHGLYDVTEERRGFSPRPHIQTLSDLIFGLALSIGAITLIGRQPTNAQEVFVALGQYGFSFLVLVGVWRSYSTIMSVLPVETGRLINLNVILLFLVSIEPYLYYQVLVFTNEDWNGVSTAFALDLGLMFLILASFSHSLTDEEKKLIPDNLLRRFRINRDLQLLTSALFLLSIAPVFYTTMAFSIPVEGGSRNMPLRVVMWILPLLLSWIRHPLEALASRLKRPSAQLN
jgi:uncharacterized membrane protein